MSTVVMLLGALGYSSLDVTSFLVKEEEERKMREQPYHVIGNQLPCFL